MSDSRLAATLRAACDDQDVAVRRAALHVLAVRPELAPRFMGVLIAARRHDDTAAAAAEVLSGFAPELLRPHDAALHELLRRVEPAVRTSAARLLRRLR